MKTSFFKRQSVWVGILLTGLVIISVFVFISKDRFKVENYQPLLKHSLHNDTATVFNLGFESFYYNGAPKGWFNWGYSIFYTTKIDSVVRHSGKYSILMEPIENSSFPSNYFGCIARSFPAKYIGDNITVKAFMRTEGVTKPIGLMLRIDNDWKTLQFDNMTQKGITGSEEWVEYSVTLPLPEEASYIYIGAMLTGTGKLWVDDFQLLIDGKDISKAKHKPEKVYLAEKDTEFDKGSKISIISYNSATVTNLELLCRIWGFLKYYHPAVATGDYNWDAELFRIMPSVINSKNTDERDKVFVDWINRLGKLKFDKNNDKEQDTLVIKILPDFSWMENSGLSNTLSKKLKAVKDASRGMEHYYIVFTKDLGSPIFKNEKNYDKINYHRDAGMSLLTLFRYWNMIEYFFPYKYLTDKDWNAVLSEFIPVFLDISHELDYKKAVSKLIAQTNDTQAGDGLSVWKGFNSAQYITSYVDEVAKIYRLRSNEFRVPYKISFIEGKAVITGILKNDMSETILKNGDIITHIDGKTIETIIEERKPYYSASNTPALFQKIAGDLLYTDNNFLSLQIIRNGKPQICKIDCFPLSNLSYIPPKKDSHRFLSPETGYIFTQSLASDSIPAIMEMFKDTKSIIIDTRGDSRDNYLKYYYLASFLLPKSEEYAKISKGNIKQPGMFSLDESYKFFEKNEHYYKGKIVVIVNEQTVGMDILSLMAFQKSPHVTIIGSSATGLTTICVSYIVLPGIGVTKMTGNGVYYPDGRETHRAGIKLDLEVKPTIKGIIEGRDEVLERAVELVKN